MSDALHYRILVGVQTDIRTLDLEGIPDAQVYLKKLPTDRGVLKPAALVGPWDKETIEQGHLEGNWVSYPSLVTFLAVNNQDLTVEEAELKWRQRVIDKFRPGRITGVPEVFRAVIEPQPIIDPKLFLEQQVFVGAILFRFWAETARSD